MASIHWQSLAYIFAQGLITGLIVGVAVRKLNKLIAAALGFAIVAVNLLWFIRVLEIDLPIPPQVASLIDKLVALIPITSSALKDAFGPMLPILTSLPFIGGLLLGGWVGFKLA